MQRFPGLVASTETSHRPRRLIKPSIEHLETRELMSQSPFSLLFQAPPAKNPPVVPRAVSGELPKNVSGRVQGLYELSLTQHPLYQGTVFGHVIKAPMFNPGYTGPKRLDLDVIGTNARISPQQGLQLTGDVLGPIDPAQPAIYSFLIDRDGSSAPGSTRGRPTISYDLEVRVTDGQGGPVGTVSLLNSQQQATSTVTLPASRVRVKGHTVQVTVPSSLMPSTASRGTNPAITRNFFYAFEAAVPGGLPSDIAGFAPEYASTMVGRVGSTSH